MPRLKAPSAMGDEVRLVRPRWLWAGLCVLILGMLVVGGAVIEHSLPWILTGLVLMALGATASIHGGLLRDTQTRFRPRQELRDIHEGRVHVAAGSEVARPPAEAVRHSQAADTRRRALLAASIGTVRPSLARPGAAVALVVCTWLLIAQWSIYPMSRIGQNNALRDLGVGIVLALAALRIVLAGRRFAASALLAAGGAALVLFGALMPHESPGVAISELLSGVVVLICAGASLDGGGSVRSSSPPRRGTSTRA